MNVNYYLRRQDALINNSAGDTITDANPVLVTKSIATGQYWNGEYGEVRLNNLSGLSMSMSEPTTAFGDMAVEMATPTVQVDCVNNVLLDSDVETFSATGGLVYGDEGLFTCETGTSVGGYGVIRSRRSAKYRPGQGAMARVAAAFTEGVASSLQLAGLFNSYSGLWFGYDGTSFGVCRRHSGALEIVEFELTAGATSAGNGRLLLNGVTFEVPLTIGSIAHNLFEFASFDYGADWEAFQRDGTIIFQNNNAAVLGGGYTYIGAATGTTGTLTILQSGAANVETWTPQANWTNDPLDGTGRSTMLLDPTKLNVYQIVFHYLGAGSIKYYVESDLLGSPILVHTEPYVNEHNVTNLPNPSMSVGIVAASLGSTTDLMVTSGSFYGGVQGIHLPRRNPRSVSHSKTGVTTALTQIISIRLDLTLAGTVSQVEAVPIAISVSSDGTKAVVFKLITFATIGGEPHWTSTDAGQSAVSYDTTGTTATGGRELTTVVLGKVDSKILDLTGYRILLERGDTLTLAAQTVLSSSDITASLVYVED